MLVTECPKIYRKYLLHLLKYIFSVYLDAAQIRKGSPKKNIYILIIAGLLTHRISISLISKGETRTNVPLKQRHIDMQTEKRG